MILVPRSAVCSLAFALLAGCAGSGLDLRAPDQRSVTEKGRGGVYHRPGAEPLVATPPTDPFEGPDNPTQPALPNTVMPGGSGWADGPEAGLPPVFAPNGGNQPPPPAFAYDPPPPAQYPPPTAYTQPPAPPIVRSPDPLAPAAGTSDADPYHFSFLGKVPPEFVTDGTWITRPPVGDSLASMRGQVVFFVFSFQACEGCKMFMPTLEQWGQRYQPRGAAIIYVDNGLVDPFDDAVKAVREQKISYAYYHDPKANTLKTYGVRSFPTAYLLDKQGKVIWEGVPTAQEHVLVPLIESALAAK